MLSIPPKYPVSQVVGYIKGKSAIHLARVYGERHRGFIGQHFWARGCFVSTVGRDETVIRDYIKNQEKAFGADWPPSGGSINRGRVSVPIRRFERLTSRKPLALPFPDQGRCA